MNEIFQKEIGKLLVHNEQVRCANEILSVFDRQGGPPLLIAQMQQGKTGTAICVADQFIRNCESKNLKYEAIYLINLSDNVLKDQTDERLLKAGLSSKVIILHHSDLKEKGFSPDLTVDKRLIIVDECHVALEKSNSTKLKPFHEFMKKCGIEYGKSIDKWGNKNNYVLSVSATPYAHIISTMLDAKSFEPVRLEVSDEYYSLQQMKEIDDRFFQSEAVTDRGGNVTPFFIERVNEFFRICEKDGPGHMVVRSIKTGPEAIEKYFKDNYPNVNVRVFASAPINNIRSLDDILSQSLPNPFIAIIKGSMRAGKTLTTTKHIRMWIEPPNSKTDTVCQVVGRCLGFEMEDDGAGTSSNRRFKDEFPFYCEIREIDRAIEFYNKYDCIPSGVRNSSNRNRRKYIVMISTWDDIPEVYRKINKKGNPAATRLSAYSDDLAASIYNGSYHSGSNTPHVHIDKCNEIYKASWDRLVNKYPFIEDGIYYTYQVEDTAKTIPVSYALLDPKSILSNI